MTDQGELNRPSAPSQFHLAFALAIVKQKPPEKEIKDYIMEIRRFIHSDMQVDSPEKFFDSVAFWQNAYKESEAEQTKLLNKIFELEQRVQSLRSKTDHSQMKGDSPTTKRKHRLTGNENGQGTPAKMTQSPGTAIGNPYLRQGNEESETDEENANFKLLRQIHTVQSALKKKKQSKFLIREAVALCKIAESEILGAIIQSTQLASELKDHPNQQTKNHILPSVFKAVEIAFNLAHQGLHKIMGSKDERHGKGQIIYYLVCLFQSTMTALAQNCAAASSQVHPKRNGLQDISNPNRMPPSKRNKGSKGKAALVPKTNSVTMINETAQQLTNLLCAMTLSLDLKRGEDQEIMEGILFVAIERVGKILALFTFNDIKKPEDILPGLNPPQGLTAMKEEAMTPKRIESEAKYLLIFLERVLGREFTQTEAAQPEFLRNTKLRFQKTLLQAVFGDDDPLFEHGLVRPRTPPALRSSQGGDRQSFSEWFTGELWRLVGWDILNSVAQSESA